MSAPKIMKVDLSHFPVDERFVQIPGKLVLTDNLEDDGSGHEIRQHPNIPVQATMGVIIICVSGQIELDIEQKPYTLRDGYTALLVPNTFMQMKHIQEGTQYVIFAISTDFIKHIGNVKTGVEFGNALKEKPVHQPTTAKLQEAITIYRALKKKLLDKEYMYKEEVAKSYLHILQCDIFQNFAKIHALQEESRSISRKEEIFKQFVKEVKENYMTHRNVAFYADKLCVSPKHLSHVVYAASGQYATEWIHRYVILEAKTMLKMEGGSIKDVSNKLNFANQSFFSKYFKQHTGYTPKEYKSF